MEVSSPASSNILWEDACGHGQRNRRKDSKTIAAESVYSVSYTHLVVNSLPVSAYEKKMVDSYTQIAGSYMKDLETGEVTFDDGKEFLPKTRSETVELSSPEYNPYHDSPEPQNINIEPRVVIGTDNRIKVEHPKDYGEHRNTVHLSIQFPKGESMGTGFMIGPNAVSYTHLDVYKRQTLSCGKWSTVTLIR